MRVRALLFRMLTSVLIAHAQEDVFTCKTPALADIVILVDGSSSVGRVNFKTLKNFLESLVQAFVVGSEHTRVGLVQYSGDPRIEWHLNTHSTNESVIDAVRNLPYKGGNTLTGLALTYILENSFKPESGSRPDIPKIVILITDGKSQDDVLSPAQRLRDAGIELFAIGIKSADENELRAIASPPEDTHMYNVANFSALSSIVKGVTRSVCERISEISKEISEDVFTCKTPALADIVFLVDGSWSIGRFNFKTLKNFLESLVQAFVVGSEHTRVGLVQYSGDPRIEWHLNTHSTKEAVIYAVLNLPYKGGNTLTGLALTYILENSFKPESGSRPDVPKIVILITDGKSEDDVLSPAQRLRDAGIELFAIGIKKADENELRAIVPSLKDTHMYNLANFSALFSIVEGVTRSICERISEISKEISGKAVPYPQSDAPSDLETSEVKGFWVTPTRPAKL
ncbi:collagen alpha-1(XIV) chain-like [Pseudorasbora parva]|uniref:collagen alpha-1(XIV) chain-like n=1 Tax=Pseudorasbora parva TaxID=51549 RepID=UPI00351EC88E